MVLVVVSSFWATHFFRQAIEELLLETCATDNPISYLVILPDFHGLYLRTFIADTQQLGIDADWSTQMAWVPCSYLGCCCCSFCNPEGDTHFELCLLSSQEYKLIASDRMCGSFAVCATILCLAILAGSSRIWHIAGDVVPLITLLLRWDSVGTDQSCMVPFFTATSRCNSI